MDNLKLIYSRPSEEVPMYISAVQLGGICLGYGINSNKHKCIDKCLSELDEQIKTILQFRSELLELKERI
jgi:hypothetical protein